MSVLETYYRLPSDLLPQERPGWASAEAVVAAVNAIKAVSAERPSSSTTNAASTEQLLERCPNRAAGPYGLPCAVDALVDDLRLERYHARDTPPDSRFAMMIKAVYYLVRPLMPVGIRKPLQRTWLKGWESIPFPVWPVDTTVEAVLSVALKSVLKERGGELPFIWFWPDGRDACAIMTHDVETADGRDFCGAVMDLEKPFGITSAFEIVPEERYEVPEEFLSSIRAGGCEVCVHDLNHDGRLFSQESIVLERSKRINEHADRFGAVGFRSAVMYRNVDWFKYFTFKYDMSMPNVGHLDPQRGGCCTVMPYRIGDLLELPLTTVQDYPLFHNLERYDTTLWSEQIEIILQQHGLISFIVHPDYIVPKRAQTVYQQLLAALSQLRDDRNVWIALPRDVYSWWTEREQMRLVRNGDAWRIEGDGGERATIACLRLEGGRLAIAR
jgi:hypothetical protein